MERRKRFNGKKETFRFRCQAKFRSWDLPGLILTVTLLLQMHVLVEAGGVLLFTHIIHTIFVIYSCNLRPLRQHVTWMYTLLRQKALLPPVPLYASPRWIVYNTVTNLYTSIIHKEWREWVLNPVDPLTAHARADTLQPFSGKNHQWTLSHFW